jgi:hypothetical protein
MTGPAPRRCFYADRPTARPDCQLTATATVGRIPLCSSCLARRSTLGKGQPVRPLPTGGDPHQVDPLDWIDEAAAELRVADDTLRAAVHRARQRGHSWTLIGQRLNITRQAAQQRFHQATRTPNQPEEWGLSTGHQRGPQPGH